MYKCIDVSMWNGTIDWEMVKASGVDCAIIRIGVGSDYESQDDDQAVRNMRECERIGMPYGVYLYSYALSIEQARSEAAHALRMVNGFNPVLGVWYDMEDADGYKANHGLNPYDNGSILTDFCLEFMRIVKDAGYVTGVYGNPDYFYNVLDDDRLTAFDGWHRWLAHWGVSEPSMDCLIWQYSSDGDVDGSSARTDMNWYYGDLDGIKPSEPSEQSTRKTNQELALEVLDGLWGNGDDRYNRLTEAGYDYDAVQSIVNEMCSASRKTVDELAHEVIAGKWGNGSERYDRLTASGYDYDEVQSRVNDLMGKKSNEDIASEVILGKWGNGQERYERLTEAGYDYDAIQGIVNERLR